MRWEVAMAQRRLIQVALIGGFITALLLDGGPSVADQTGPSDTKGSSDASAVKRAPNSEISSSAKTEKSSLIVTSDYYIGPEDVLEIIVWRNADLSKVVTVRPDGRISLPLLGDIEANGLTPVELTGTIATRLKQFKETPTVSVSSYGIYVLGEVAKPGRFFLKSKTTLLQAITMAGGFTQTAAKDRMVVFRMREGKEEKLKASYYDIVMKDASKQNVILKPGDTIVVPSETMVMTD
jgi:polysaccharide biosynthesis/export protein